MPDPAPLELCHSLASVELPNQRSVRFSGESLHTLIESYPHEDQEVLKSLYSDLFAVYELLRPFALDPNQEPTPYTEQLANVNVEDLLSFAQRLGVSGGDYSGECRRAIHDIRGGALISLLLE